MSLAINLLVKVKLKLKGNSPVFHQTVSPDPLYNTIILKILDMVEIFFRNTMTHTSESISNSTENLETQSKKTVMPDTFADSKEEDFDNWI